MGYLIDGGRDNGFEGAEDDPDGRGNKGESEEVDVVVDGVDEGGEEEPQGFLQVLHAERGGSALRSTKSNITCTQEEFN